MEKDWKETETNRIQRSVTEPKVGKESNARTGRAPGGGGGGGGARL